MVMMPFLGHDAEENQKQGWIITPPLLTLTSTTAAAILTLPTNWTARLRKAWIQNMQAAINTVSFGSGTSSYTQLTPRISIESQTNANVKAPGTAFVTRDMLPSLEFTATITVSPNAASAGNPVEVLATFEAFQGAATST